MLKLIKILRLLVHLFAGAGIVMHQALIKGRDAQNPEFRSKVQQWYQKACALVGLEVTVHGKPAEGPVLVVANHISWLDIPLMASQANPRFLSKSEIRKWPIIGWAAEKLDTLFIVRGQRTAAEAASAAISGGLTQGDRILIFPEGTTTRGEEIGFMYPRLFGAAVNAGSPIQPVVIHYTDDNSDRHSSDLVPYVDKQTLVGNLWRLLGSRNLKATVYFLDPVDSLQGVPRKELAAGIQAQMQDCLQQSHTAYLSAKPLIHK